MPDALCAAVRETLSVVPRHTSATSAQDRGAFFGDGSEGRTRGTKVGDLRADTPPETRDTYTVRPC